MIAKIVESCAARLACNRQTRQVASRVLDGRISEIINWQNTQKVGMNGVMVNLLKFTKTGLDSVTNSAGVSN